MKTVFAKKARRVALVPLALVSGSALATETGGSSIDTTGLVSTIEGAMTPVGAVGLAVLGVLAGILVFKLIRRVM
ncbi:major capsid protein [Halomonas beimenensis]|uniref:Uncharacterized protein n=1 Tax=Halomonas beimenensis TaxID=475662 RepID=A0A291P9Z9_9GAMM|nr:major capsid protein [Halomonas beimenensis]ATJ81227.1 hypothetical protein BEI_0240 [Halomonas beimenensis]ATJ83697.1 hypothetical protein BEI_2710 [Halomonas beimenensis]